MEFDGEVFGGEAGRGWGGAPVSQFSQPQPKRMNQTKGRICFSMAQRGAWILLSVTGLCVVLTGCGRFRRYQDCRQVIEVVNNGLDEVELEVSDEHPSAQEYLRVSQSYSKLAQQLTHIDIQTPHLDRAVEQYRQLIEQAARATKEASMAQLSKEREQEQSSEQDLRRLHYRHEKQSKWIDRLCHDP
jgi:hypothetical protein